MIEIDIELRKKLKELAEFCLANEILGVEETIEIGVSRYVVNITGEAVLVGTGVS